MSSDQEIICSNYENLFTKIAWVNAIEFLCGAYYFILVMLGFRNIYIIFYTQRKLANIIFPLMYVLGQLICILQITQCFMFVRLNLSLKKSC